MYPITLRSLLLAGSTLVLDTLQLVISELQSPRSTGQALGPAGLLGASTFGAAISVSAESTLVLADVDLVLPWAQFHSYFKSICQADGWAYTETLQARQHLAIRQPLTRLTCVCAMFQPGHCGMQTCTQPSNTMQSKCYSASRVGQGPPSQSTCQLAFALCSTHVSQLAFQA